MAVHKISLDIMGTIKSVAQAYIDENNSQYGDTLIDAFEPSAYYLYSTPQIGVFPPHKVFWLQFIETDEIEVVQNSMNSELIIPMSINVILASNANNNFIEKVIRMNEIIKKIIEKEVLPMYTSSSLLRYSPFFGKSDKDYGIASIKFSIVGG